MKQETKKQKGRPKNPLWNTVINLGMFKTKTNPEIKQWLETKGFNTHLVNVAQMRKRLAGKGADVACRKPCKRGRKPGFKAAAKVAQDDTLVVI